MLVRSPGAGSIRVTRTKAVVLETVQTLSATARDVLFAYAMTGSAIASLVIIAAPHLEMLLRFSIAEDEPPRVVNAYRD
jgi:hypothetical protein